MKTITLKEFAELAKNDETLKEKIIKCVKPGGGVPQELIDLAADYGYELTEEGIYSTVYEDEELSDEELQKVAGGLDPVVDISDLCKFVLKLFFMYEPGDC